MALYWCLILFFVSVVCIGKGHVIGIGTDIACGCGLGIGIALGMDSGMVKGMATDIGSSVYIPVMRIIM